MKKVILAFSGGLDTSFCVPFLQEQGFQVITVTVNTGGFSKNELSKIKAKSKELKAINHYEIDAQEELYNKFANYIIKANYLKGGAYPACVGPERNIIAQKISEIAIKEDTKIIAHGCTGAGNDQVRLDLALNALIPNCKIIAPIRENELSRAQEIQFLEEKGFVVDSKVKDYSINVGMLGTTLGGKETYNTHEEIPNNIFPTVKSIENAKSEPTKVLIEFKNGLPIAINGKTLNGVQIIKELNKIGAENGFGKDYHIGTTIIGIKAKIGFEAPALKMLIKAHTELEKIILTSKQIFWKNHLGNVYGDLIHEGLYYDPVIKDLEAFLNSSSSKVNGEVIIKIHKGNLTISSIKSPNSIFGLDGTYGELTGKWNGKDAEGFCKIYGMESTNAFLKNFN